MLPSPYFTKNKANASYAFGLAEAAAQAFMQIYYTYVALGSTRTRQRFCVMGLINNQVISFESAKLAGDRCSAVQCGTVKSRI